MDKVLERNNLDLLQEVKACKKLIRNKTIPDELKPDPPVFLGFSRIKKWVLILLNLHL